jgi:hypothetical protein
MIKVVANDRCKPLAIEIAEDEARFRNKKPSASTMPVGRSRTDWPNPYRYQTVIDIRKKGSILLNRMGVTAKLAA